MLLRQHHRHSHPTTAPPDEWNSLAPALPVGEHNQEFGFNTTKLESDVGINSGSGEVPLCLLLVVVVVDSFNLQSISETKFHLNLHILCLN